MTKNKENLTQLAAAYVREYLLEHQPSHFFFHNIAYAEDLALAAEKIAHEAGLSPVETEQLVLAAWFNNTGFAKNYEDHALNSATIAEAWLTEQAYPPEQVSAVHQLLSRAKEDAPKDVYQRIFHDALWAWTGRKKFAKSANLLLLEWEQQYDKQYDSSEWAQYILDLLMQKAFLTAPGNDLYNDRRVDNITAQRTALAKAREDDVKKLSGKNFGRGIDTLFRTSFRNHINLSRIADGKANMMISINTIVLSIILAVSGAGIGIIEDQFFENPAFVLPIITLLLSSLTALVFAVFSARPKVTEYRIGQRLEVSPEASLLYFGNFLQLPKDKFIEYLSDLKLDQERLYNDLSRDLYSLGQVLHKKYLLLTISYNTFVGGLVLSVIVFLVVFFFSSI